MSSDDTGAPLDVVVQVLYEVLGSGSALTADTQLFDLPGFDSMALAALVEGLEARIGLPLADELITPDAFATPGLIVEHLVRPTLRGELR
jgi:acyl carrier protein